MSLWKILKFYRYHWCYDFFRVSILPIRCTIINEKLRCYCDKIFWCITRHTATYNYKQVISTHLLRNSHSQTSLELWNRSPLKTRILLAWYFIYIDDFDGLDFMIRNLKFAVLLVISLKFWGNPTIANLKYHAYCIVVYHVGMMVRIIRVWFNFMASCNSTDAQRV